MRVPAIGGKTDLQDVYPYPTQKESAVVRKIFDEFVGTLREKSLSRNTALWIRMGNITMRRSMNA